jgi:hypothetical protein
MGKGGLTGVSTILKPGPDGEFIWPQVIEEPHKPFPHDRWDDDREAPLPRAMFDFKEYEMKLLAALAQCYRGAKTFADLPMIPVQMADVIMREGCLQEWLRRSPRRVERFWKIVEDQEKGTKLLPKSAVRGRRRKRR